MSYFDEAKKKLDAEAKAGKFDRYGNAMKNDVLKALKEFSSQSEIFAEAVVKGRSFEECMKAVGKGVSGGSISDLKAYQLAVQYYMAYADVRFCMEIKIGKEQKSTKTAAVKASDDITQPTPQKKSNASKSVMIDLTQFF